MLSRLKWVNTLRRQDLSLLLLHVFGCSKLRLLAARARQKPMTRFLVLHDVPDSCTESFKRGLAFLKESANVLTIQDYLNGKVMCDRLNIVITFDDGYKGWLTNAVPALLETGLPATFFISSGFLDLSEQEQWRFFQTRLTGGSTFSGGLSNRDVREIASLGFTIGGHTTNHVNLGKVSDANLAAVEIRDDKRELEDITSREVKFFAFPYGVDANPNFALKPLLTTSGYEAAVTVMSGNNETRQDRLSLHREVLWLPMAMAVFKARVSGAYDMISLVKRMARFKQKPISEI
jgi:peptidoglycan/xylan/chitin deacetylase (PgdA/CDA1 family)